MEVSLLSSTPRQPKYSPRVAAVHSRRETRRASLVQTLTPTVLPRRSRLQARLAAATPTIGTTQRVTEAPCMRIAMTGTGTGTGIGIGTETGIGTDAAPRALAQAAMDMMTAHRGHPATQRAGDTTRLLQDMEDRTEASPPRTGAGRRQRLLRRAEAWTGTRCGPFSRMWTPSVCYRP